MDTLTLTLGDRRFLLRPGTSARRLERRLVAAMRCGAGVVRLPLASGEHVDAVVSSALPVTVERISASADAAQDEEWRYVEQPVEWGEFA
jgi:hypothetical protein